MINENLGKNCLHLKSYHSGFGIITLHLLLLKHEPLISSKNKLTSADSGGCLDVKS